MMVVKYKKSEYKRKLDELKSFSSALSTRFYEHSNRNTAVEVLRSSIHNYQSWVNNVKDEKYSHIDQNERKQVSDEANKMESWLQHVVNEMAKLNKHDDAKVTINTFHAKKTELEKFCNPIINRPKPAPPKPKEEPKPSPSPSPDKNAAAATDKDKAPSSADAKADASKPAADKSASTDADASAKMDTEQPPKA